MPRAPRRMAPRNNSRNGQARTPLLPSGVNNKATMPESTQQMTVRGEELVALINVPAGSTSGQIIYNDTIKPTSARRLGILSTAFQRIDWKTCSLHLVALNGSTVKSGYTMGWVEDPEITIPSGKSEVIGFLTSLRATTVRQAWVESTAGMMVQTQDKPEMYTQLGSDIRRYSPGRLVAAVAGDVGEAATFQLMLRYTVRLYVPMAVGVADEPNKGLKAIFPTANNIAVRVGSLTYPGVGTDVTSGTVLNLTRHIIGIELQTGGTRADGSPPNGFRVFSPGTEIRVNTIEAGAPVSFSFGPDIFTFSRTDFSGTNRTAFTTITPITQSTGYKCYDISEF